MEKENIRSEIIAIMNKIKTFDSLWHDIPITYYDEPITGIKIKFTTVELTYLFLEIRKAYKVCFVKDDIENYKFNTINNITEIILNKKNHQ